MTWLTKILGAADVPGKVVDIAGDGIKAVTSGIDELYYTDEEKAQARDKIFKMWADHQVTALQESSIRSITRRKLAVGIVQIYLFLVLFGTIVWKIDREWAAYVFSVVGSMSALMLMVTGFYFGPYLVGRDIIKRIKEK